MDIERVETVVIGGGQAGLSVGYHLARRGRPFVILESNERIGDSWRRRWDSLRLFTPARMDKLAGMRFPGDADAFPTKDEMADYLELYAERQQLAVRTGVRVEQVTRADDLYDVVAGDQHLVADQVVVAMSSYQRPQVPPYAAELDPDIVQLHSSEYRHPGQLRQGPVLVVGGGNSGAEIAGEVCRTHQTTLAGRHVGEMPFRVDGWSGRVLMRPILRGLFHRVLTTSTPIGRRARPKIISQGGPLIRAHYHDLVEAGVELLPRLVGVSDGSILLEGGRVLPVANVIWCTGFQSGLSWVDLPTGDFEHRHDRGVVTGEPGFYLVGQHFLYAMSSGMIHGVDRDAAHVAAAISQRMSDRPVRLPAERRSG